MLAVNPGRVLARDGSVALSTTLLTELESEGPAIGSITWFVRSMFPAAGVEREIGRTGTYCGREISFDLCLLFAIGGWTA